MTEAPVIASQYSIRRIKPETAELGALVLFQPPITERTGKPPSVALGIFSDGINDDRSNVRGITWLDAACDFVPIDQTHAIAIVETFWQLVPDVRRAEFRSPTRGDLLCCQTGETGLVIGTGTLGKWALLSLKTAVASIWRADREGLVMPWKLVAGDAETGREVLFEHKTAGT